MRLVMFNDCSSVGETLLQYLPTEVEGTLITRTRGLWSKTFGISHEILKAHADIYQCNYLFQDCYVALRAHKRPMIGWCLGSDIRKTLKHRIYGRIVKHNLKNCDRLLVSTPDLLPIVREYREDIEYFPPIIDESVFIPTSNQLSEKIRVFIASNVNWATKGTDKMIHALSLIKEHVDVSIIRYGPDFDETVKLSKHLGVTLTIKQPVSHDRMCDYYWNADVVLDQFIIGSAGMVALEAIGCGRPAITYVSSVYPEYDEFPLKDIKYPHQIAEAILDAGSRSLLDKECEYVMKNHSWRTSVPKLLKIYEEVRD